MLALEQKTSIQLDAVQDATFTGQTIEIGKIAREKGEKDSGQWWKGKGDKEETGIRVFDVKVRLDGSDSRLRSGMAGSLEIIVETIPDVISAPLEAVFKKQDGSTYVHVVESGRVSERVIKTGRSADGSVVVTEGLTEGEVVCLAEPETVK